MQLFEPLVFNQAIRMSVMGKRQRHFFQLSEILYCQSDRNYTIFYLSDGSELCSTNTLAEVYERLKPHGFEQLHKSIVANLSCISSVSHTQEAMVTLVNKKKIKIARRRKPVLIKILKMMPNTVRPEISTERTQKPTVG